jgi:hypothetical protein
MLIESHIVIVFSPILSTPYRTDRELFWIKELGTAMPYGCNDNIKGTKIPKDKGQKERKQKANNSSHYKTTVSATGTPQYLKIDTKAQDDK